MALKGFPGNNAFNNSKLASRKVMSDSKGKGMVKHGTNNSRKSSLKSGTKGVKLNGK